MIGQPDQDPDSNTKSQDEDKDDEDPINLPRSSSGGGRFRDMEDPINLPGASFSGGPYPGYRRVKKKKYQSDYNNNKYTQGVTHINLKDKAPPKMTEDQVHQHVLSVIFHR